MGNSAIIQIKRRVSLMSVCFVSQALKILKKPSESRFSSF